MNDLVIKLKWKILLHMRDAANRKAARRLEENGPLWKELQSYIKKSKSTGCSYSDYWELYKFVRAMKPKEILECGTGVTTIVLAHALIENDRDGVKGTITSMEELEQYYDMARELLPPHMNDYVEFILSPRIEDTFSLFRGVRYRDTPNRAYDFVFVDGPNYHALSDGMKTFDFDFFHVVRKSETPVYAIVDKRTSSCYVAQKVFGLDKVRYNVVQDLGFIGPCTRDDMRSLDQQPTIAFYSNRFSFFGNTELKMRLLQGQEKKPESC